MKKFMPSRPVVLAASAPFLAVLALAFSVGAIAETPPERGLMTAAGAPLAQMPGTPPGHNHDAPHPGAPPVHGESAPPAHGESAPPAQHATPKPPAAADPVAPENREKLLDELYARLATAPDEATAAEVSSAIEQLWQHSGSPTADLLVARAAAEIEADRRPLAMQLLNAAVELQPDFAEAWNRRAYLHYLDSDYKRALGDLRRVLALEPRHYKALEGLANILQTVGEKKAALEAYDSLLKVHPQVPGGKKTREELRVQVEGQGI